MLVTVPQEAADTLFDSIHIEDTELVDDCIGDTGGAPEDVDTNDESLKLDGLWRTELLDVDRVVVITVVSVVVSQMIVVDDRDRLEGYDESSEKAGEYPPDADSSVEGSVVISGKVQKLEKARTNEDVGETGKDVICPEEFENVKPPLLLVIKVVI